MKFNDALWGAVLTVFGVALLLHARGFPTIPGQRVGPGLFPSVIAVGLAVCGVILVVRGLRQRTSASGGAAWFGLPEWARSPSHVIAFAVLVAVNLLYLLAVDRLGFVVIGFIYLAALMWVLRVPPVRIVPIAMVLTLAIHFCFYKLLRVPLPWGVLQSVAW